MSEHTIAEFDDEYNISNEEKNLVKNAEIETVVYYIWSLLYKTIALCLYIMYNLRCLIIFLGYWYGTYWLFPVLSS